MQMRFEGSYDGADDRTQADVRAVWDKELTARIANLDLTEELQASGRPWAEADDDGAVVVRGPGVIKD